MVDHRHPAADSVQPEQHTVRLPPIGADTAAMFQFIIDEMQRSAESRHRWQTNVSGVLLGMQADIAHVSDRQDAAKENCRNHAELAESVRSVHQLLQGAFGNGGMVSDLTSIRKTTHEIRQEQVSIKLQLNQYAADQANIKVILQKHEEALRAREDDCTRLTTAVTTAVTPAKEAWWLTQVKQHTVTTITTIAFLALMFGALPAAKQFMGIAEPTKAVPTPAPQTHAGP